jgi:CDP-glycerol glycerophosphotransferase (TagB/SpsB family)
MKNVKKPLIFCFAFFFCTTFSAFAQDNLNSQYLKLKEKSNNYQEFKVIEETALDAFWKGVQDSVKAPKRKLAEANREINSQKAQLTQLQRQLKAKETENQRDNYACSRVPVLGIGVDKNSYATFSYFMYAALLGILGFVFFSYQNSNRVTVSTRKDYSEAKQQMETYQKKLLETQTALGRELQTERNKIEDMQQEINQLRNQKK